MESLYELNKKLLVREGRMLRIAINEGVKRESFIEHYLSFNFEKNWIQSLLALKDKNWEKFINRNHIEINKLIEEIKEIQDAHKHTSKLQVTHPPKPTHRPIAESSENLWEFRNDSVWESE